MKMVRLFAFAFSAILIFVATPVEAEDDHSLLREACDFMFDDACTKKKENISEWWGRQKERYGDIKESITGAPGKVREGASGWADRVFAPLKEGSMTQEEKKAVTRAAYARWGSLDAETRGLLRQGWQPPGRESEGRTLTPEQIEAKRLTGQMTLQEYVQRGAEGESPYAETVRRFAEEEKKMKAEHIRVGNKCYFRGERIGCAVQVGGDQNGGKCLFGGELVDCDGVKIETVRSVVKKEPRCLMDGQPVDCAESQRLFREANPRLAKRYEAYERDEKTGYFRGAENQERRLKAEATRRQVEAEERERREAETVYYEESPQNDVNWRQVLLQGLEQGLEIKKEYERQKRATEAAQQAAARRQEAARQAEYERQRRQAEAMKRERQRACENQLRTQVENAFEECRREYDSCTADAYSQSDIDTWRLNQCWHAYRRTSGYPCGYIYESVDYRQCAGGN